MNGSIIAIMFLGILLSVTNYLGWRDLDRWRRKAETVIGMLDAYYRGFSFKDMNKLQGNVVPIPVIRHDLKRILDAADEATKEK